MRRVVVAALAICLVCPSLVIGGDTLDDSGKPASESKPYKVKATLVSVNLQTMQVTYLDAGTGASGSAALSGKAAFQSAELKPGTPVSLQVRSVAPSNTLVVESINKRSHKKLVIWGLVLATVVVGTVAIASAGPI